MEVKFNLLRCKQVMVHHLHTDERPGIIIFTDAVAGVVGVTQIAAALKQLEKALSQGSMKIVDSADTYCLLQPVPSTVCPNCDVCGTLMIRHSGLLVTCPKCGNTIQC